MKSVVRVLTVAALAAMPAVAQNSPITDRGFDPEKAYQLGEVDQVNLQSGAVSIVLPIGSFPVSGQLQYGLTLSYNSKIWEYKTHQEGPELTLEAMPSRRSNAGVGWHLGFSYLIAPDDPINETNRWLLGTADGGEHEFWSTLHVRPNQTDTTSDEFTRDGSYIRLRHVGPDKEVDLPEGQTMKFTLSSGKWRLSEMRDRTGNWVRVEYEVDSKTSQPIWRIHDNANSAPERTHLVFFKSMTYDTGQTLMVDKIELAGFDSTTPSTYTFHYMEDGVTPPPTVWRDCFDSYSFSTEELTVARLSSIDQPDGSAWHFQYWNDNSDLNCKQSELQQVQLPTKGTIDYDYQTIPVPEGHPCPADDQLGGTLAVNRRTLEDPFDSTSDGFYEYLYEVSVPPGTGDFCPASPDHDFWPSEQFKITIKTPTKDKVEHFFSIWPGWHFNVVSPNGFRRIEYGLPVTHGLPSDPTDDPIGNRLLSSRTFDCDSTGNNCVLKRSEYLTYESDGPADDAETRIGKATQRNRRVKGRRTVYNDDDLDPGPGTNLRYRDVESRDFDGLSHYRSTIVTANFAQGNDRVDTTSFNTGFGGSGGVGTFELDPDTGIPTANDNFQWANVNANWILGLYEETTQCGASLASCEASPGLIAHQKYSFDTSTGLLSCKRVQKGNGLGANDSLVVYTYAGGNMQTERWYGGDRQTLATGSTCSSAASFDYGKDFVWQHGSLKSSQNKRPGGADEPFQNFDRTIDLNTGLVKFEWDSSDYQRRYFYDELNRLIEIEPTTDGAAHSNIDYQNASVGEPAKVYQDTRDGGTTFTRSWTWYDGFGRPFVKRVLRPGGAWARSESRYNAMGWKTQQSEVGPDSGTLYWTQYLNFDPFGRPGIVRPPDGSAHDVTFSYVGAFKTSRTVKVATNISGAETWATTVETYDGQGRLASVEEPSGAGGATNWTAYWYDEAGRLEHSYQSDGGNVQHREFLYDRRGFPQSESHVEKGGLVRYLEYDSKGHAWKMEDGSSSRALLFDYDKSERLEKVTEGSGLGRVLKEFTYGEDVGPGLSKLETATRHNYAGAPINADVKVVETYSYGGPGGFGRRITHRKTQLYHGALSMERFEQGWQYDQAGNVILVQQPECYGGAYCGSGTTPIGISKVWSEGLLTQVTNFAQSITYNRNGLVSTIQHNTSTPGVYVVDTIANDPHHRLRPRSFTTSNIQGSANWATGDYAYDGAGNIKAIGLDKYRYDGVSRLVEGRLHADAINYNSQSYTFDAFGNLIDTLTFSCLPTCHGSDVATPADPTTNRLSGFVTYDAAGNLTNWNGNQYTFDLLNMMVRNCSNLYGNCAGEDWLSIYTADDERIWHYQSNGATSRFTVRDLNKKVLTDFNSASIRLHYVYRGDQLISTVNHGGAVSGYHLDHLGTTRVLTNPSGAKISEHKYFPFGREFTALQNGHRHRFTGHERDQMSTASEAEDDLDYMHARFYSPLTRFLSTDPAHGIPQRPQSWNRFAYVEGNPLGSTDPTGQLTASQIAKDAQEALAKFKQNIGAAASDGSAIGVIVTWQTSNSADLLSAGLDVLTAGDAIGEAVGSQASALETGLAVGEDALKVAGIAAPVSGTARAVGSRIAAAAGRRSVLALARNLSEQLSLREAMAGGGTRIMQGRIKDAMRPENIWAKMSLTHELPGGGSIEVHYWRNLVTGVLEGFKFK